MNAFSTPDHPQGPFHLTITFETEDEGRAFYALFNHLHSPAHRMLGGDACDTILKAMGKHFYPGFAQIIPGVSHAQFYGARGIGQSAAYNDKEWKEFDGQNTPSL